MTPQEVGDRIAAIRTDIGTIDTSAAALQKVINSRRKQLSDLVTQRNDLLTEADGLMRDMRIPAWSLDLSNDDPVDPVEVETK